MQNNNRTAKPTPRRTAKATRVAAVGILASGVILAGTAVAGHCNGKRGHGHQHLFNPSALKAIQVTDAQQAQLKELMQQARTERETSRENRKAQRDNMQQQLREVFSQPTIAAADLEALHARRKAQSDTRKNQRQTHMAAMLNVLTPEQRVQLLELKKERKGKRRGDRHGG